jgi:hypothetical protein
MAISHLILLRMRSVSKKVVQKIQIHVLCSIIFFPENHAVYETMSKNVLEAEMPQMAI